MRILLTGGSGQVGQAFLELALREDGDYMVTAPARVELAVDHRTECERAVAQARPDWVVHAAAMTDVDACERDPVRAHAVNAAGSGYLAVAAARHGARMAYISTDYVFDGEQGRYREGDRPNPVSHYGRSKLEGERLVLEALPEAVVARTSVVFGPHRNNFVRWVRSNLRAGKPVKVARDQWVTPTAAHDVAAQLLALIEAGERGVWHTAGGERLSRLEMAQRIAAHDRLDPLPIQGVPMAELPWVARRPRDSSLTTEKIGRLRRPLDFDEALDALGDAA